MKLFYIDLETTGLDPESHEIIQCSGEIRNGASSESFDFRIRPSEEAALDPKTLEMGRLTEEMVRSHPYGQMEAFEALKALLGRHVDRFDPQDKLFMLGYNVRFDDSFLRAWFDKFHDHYYGSWFWFPPLDIMQLAAFTLIGDRPYMKNFQLVTVYEHLTGKSLEKAHSSDVDIAATQEILSLLWAKWKGDGN